MLKFNSFRAQRYSRSRFVEGAFLLASEATDLQLEILDQLRETIRKSVGDVAVADAWKVEELSTTQLLVKPGEAWLDGTPFVMRSGGDHLVSGSSLIAGDVPAGTVVTDDASGLGKIITFNSGATTPSDTYRVVITAREELIDDTDDPFIKNANLTESTGQKLRLQYRIDIVPESAQTETPVPYTNDIGDQNLINKIVVTPSAAGNGELISTNLLSGAEGIDGRDLELVLRNDPGVGSGNPIPNGTADQAAFQNGRLIDSVGNEYHINEVFNDTIATQVVLRIDKEVDQPNPQIINGSAFTLKKRAVYVTDNTNGNPQGKLFYPVATVVWDSTDGVVSESSVTDLRTVVERTENFQEKTNKKINLHIVGGGDVAFSTTAGANRVSWSSDLKIINPSGSVMTISASDAVILDNGSLVYELDLDSGGSIDKGQLSVTVSSAGSTISLNSIDLSNVRIGNVIEDSGGDTAYITSIDNVNDQLVLNTAISNTGSATIYLDSFGAGQAPNSVNSYCVATTDNSKIYFANQLELELGETSQIGDGLSSEVLALLGSSVTETISTPYPYSSTTVIANTDGYMEAIGKLDADLGPLSSPSYSSDIRGVSNESLVDRAGTLTDAVGDSQEDRSAYLRATAEVTWTGTELQFTSDISLIIINTKSGTETVHNISSGDSPIAIANGEIIWVDVDRTSASETLTVNNTGTTPIPAQTQTNKDVFVLFRRTDASGEQVLHLPLHKQAVESGTTFRLGTTGAGAGGAAFDVNTIIVDASTGDVLTDDGNVLLDS